jgi:hypothetical protein
MPSTTNKKKMTSESQLKSMEKKGRTGAGDLSKKRPSLHEAKKKGRAMTDSDRPSLYRMKSPEAQKGRPSKYSIDREMPSEKLEKKRASISRKKASSLGASTKAEAAAKADKRASRMEAASKRRAGPQNALDKAQKKASDRKRPTRTIMKKTTGGRGR